MAQLEPHVRMSIAIAMDQLCQNRPYDDITVQTICETAGVSRTTFYHAFENKYSIATFYQDRVLEASIGQEGRTLDWRGGYEAAYSGWRLLPHMNKAAGKCEGYESIAANFGRKTRELLVDTIVNYKGIELSDCLDFQIDYYSSAGVIRAGGWMSEKSAGRPDGMSDYLARCVPQDLYLVLNTPDRPNPTPRLSLSIFYQ